MRRTALAALLAALIPTAAHAVPRSGLLLGVAGWAPVLVLFAGLVLLCVELFVLPGFGVAGILGLLALIAGVAWTLLGPAPGMGDVALAATAVISAATLLGVGLWAVISSRRGGYSALFGGSMDRARGYLAAPPRPELEGMDGVALTDLRPSGTAQVAGERLDVVADGSWVSAGTPVRVVSSEGYRHVVRALPLPPPEGPPSKG